MRVLEWAARRWAPRLAFGIGFGREGCVLLRMIAEARLPVDVFTLDTGLLFPETLALWRRLEDTYGIRIRAVRPEQSVEEQAVRHGERLWERAPDRCCELRKVVPLRRALAGHEAWITSIRRDQTPERAGAAVVEWDESFGLVKVNPLVSWTSEDVDAYVRAHDIPINPLHGRGYASIGCWPCTTPVQPGEDPRAGRWRGRGKTECGLHRRPVERGTEERKKMPDSAEVIPPNGRSLIDRLVPETAEILRGHDPSITPPVSKPETAAPPPKRNVGFILWLTGLSGAGKSTLATRVREELGAARSIEVLDGDEVRTHLSKGLGFSKEDRDTNIRRIAWVARALSRNGVAVIAAAISPYRGAREEARALSLESGVPFVEVFVTAPLETLIARDAKGLYRKALAGEIPSFTGITDPYEPPENPEIVVDSSLESVDESAEKVLSHLRDEGLLGADEMQETDETEEVA